MYIPKHFEAPSLDAMHQLMQAHPLATLVALTADGLVANHIPLHLTPQPAPFGTLRGHVARANPVWRDSTPEIDVLAIFHGPDAYISPNWYATKQESGKVVPTWNYAVTHAYGKLRGIDDTAWLRSQLETLTDAHEATFSTPWALSDAPADYIDKLLSAIVGIEIVITRLEGKWKVSQNQPSHNQDGVIAGLKLQESGTAMASLVEQAAQAMPDSK